MTGQVLRRTMLPVRVMNAGAKLSNLIGKSKQGRTGPMAFIEVG